MTNNTKQFKDKCYGRGLVESYDSIVDFKDKFSRPIAQTIIRDFADLNQSSEVVAFPSTKPESIRNVLTGDAKNQLKAAVRKNGHILRTRTSSGTDVQAGGENFVKEQTPREVARWQSALNELIKYELVESIGNKGQVFEVTFLGHAVADEIG